MTEHERGPARRIPCAGAIIRDGDGRLLLIRRRNEPGAGLWSLPGGRVEAGETDAQALKREVLHRLGVEVECGKLISFVSHPYEHYVVDLFLYECRLLSDELRPLAVSEHRWVASADFDQYPFTPADEASMNKLLGVG
jgi:8-oxo-dGTP diphosphatase